MVHFLGLSDVVVVPGPSPQPSPGGRGLRRAPSSGESSSARRKAPVLNPYPPQSLRLPLPAGEGWGEGPLMWCNVWSSCRPCCSPGVAERMRVLPTYIRRRECGFYKKEVEKSGASSRACQTVIKLFTTDCTDNTDGLDRASVLFVASVKSVVGWLPETAS